MNKRHALKWLGGQAALLGSAGLFGCGAGDGTDGETVATVEQDLDAAPFGGWKVVLANGLFAGPPAVLNVSGSFSRIQVYGVGTDKAIWFADRFGFSAAWTGWYTLGGVFSGKPAATMWHAAGRPDQPAVRRAVIGSGQDGIVWITVSPGAGDSFSSWQPIPNGSVVGSAAIAFSKPYLFVVTRRADNMFYWSRNDVSTGLNNARWGTWTKIPHGVFLDDPAITADKAGRFVVAGRGTDNRIWLNHTTNSGDTWSNWKPVLDELGTRTFKDAPAISFSWNSTSVEVASRGSNSPEMWVATVDPTTGLTDKWVAPEPTALSVAAEGANSPGSAGNQAAGGIRYAIAARDQTRQYYINIWDNL